MKVIELVPPFLLLFSIVLVAPHVAWVEARKLALACIAAAFVFWIVLRIT
jgi:hypothetical protein